MIPDLQSSLLCDDVRQERNGKFILIGIFDGLAVPQLPARVPRICVVHRWCCGQGAFVQHTRLVAPDGRTVVVEGKDVQIHLPEGNHTATSIEFFMNVPFEQPGAYWIEVLLEGQLRLRYPLIVRHVEAPPQPGKA